MSGSVRPSIHLSMGPSRMLIDGGGVLEHWPVMALVTVATIFFSPFAKSPVEKEEFS